MSYKPIVNPLNIPQQGQGSFPYCAGWVDNVFVSSGVSHADYNLSAALSAMSLSFNNPLTALYVIFSADGGFWFNANAAAATPSGATTNGSSSEYNPTQRYLDPSVSNLSFAATANCNVSLQFFRP